MAVPSVSVRIFTHSVVVALSGDIDLHQTAVLRRALIESMRRHPRQLIVELTATTALDQTAVGALLAVMETSADLGIRLVIRGATPPVAAQLQLSGIDRH